MGTSRIGSSTKEIIEDVVPAEIAHFAQCHWFAGDWRVAARAKARRLA